MIASIQPYTKEDERRDQIRFADFKSQIGVGHHIIVVFGCVFFCGYQLFKYSLHDETLVKLTLPNFLNSIILGTNWGVICCNWHFVC